MGLVVPVGKAGYPLPSVLQAGEGLAGGAGMVLEGLEQGLRVGVVITDRGPAEGGHDPQALQGRQHGGALHGAAVIGMQDQVLRRHPLAVVGAAEHGRGLFGAFAREDLPADDLAAEDIHEEVEVKEQPLHVRGQVGDIPAPHLIGRGRREGVRAPMGRGARPTPRRHLVSRLHHPIEGRLRTQIDPLIRQRRDDLTGWLIGECGLVDQGQDRLAFVLTQAVSGDAPLGGGGTAIDLEAIYRPPALQRARGHPHGVTGALQAHPGRAGVVDDLAHVPPLLQVD